MKDRNGHGFEWLCTVILSYNKRMMWSCHCLYIYILFTIINADEISFIWLFKYIYHLNGS